MASENEEVIKDTDDDGLKQIMTDGTDNDGVDTIVDTVANKVNKVNNDGTGNDENNIEGEKDQGDNRAIEQYSNELNDELEVGGGAENDDVGNTESRRITFQKAISLAGILVFGILVIGFGGARIKNIIGSSFVGYGVTQTGIKALNQTGIKSNEQESNDELAALKAKDTDKDGLSDYDEIYTYKTSAYIDDTDSDGVNDGEEIKSGKDPLCPEGQDCYGKTGNTDADGSEQITTDDTDITNTANVDIAQVRAALAEAGMDEATLKQVDDATLLQMYNETVKETGTDPLKSESTNATNATNTTNATSATNVGSLTADEIRKLLIDGGADANVVNGVDDATLIKTYEETMGN